MCVTRLVSLTLQARKSSSVHVSIASTLFVYHSIDRLTRKVDYIALLLTPLYVPCSLPRTTARTTVPQLQRVVYLDTDTLVLTDIQYLLDLDMKGTWSHGPGGSGGSVAWAEGTYKHRETHREREREIECVCVCVSSNES